MSTAEEIKALEEKLREAELGPLPEFFERHLADDAILDGERTKAKVVAAHQPGGSAKFLLVEMSEFELIDYGRAAVVLCKGRYVHAKGEVSLRFMRVWFKTNDQWRIIAGTVSPVSP